MPDLFTYTRSLFGDLKRHLESQGKVIASLPFFELGKQDSSRDYYIDVTSTVRLLKTPNGSDYGVEKVLYSIEAGYTLIVDERLAEDAKDLLRHHIDKTSRLEAFSSQEVAEDSSIEATTRSRVVDLDATALDSLFQHLNNELIGHSKFKARFEEEVRRFVVFNRLKEHPILSFFLMGKSGVGKTEVGRIVHRFLQPNDRLIKINFGNYSSNDSLNTLIGSPKGYIGSEGGELTDKIQHSRSGVILIDEFEKADHKIFNFFLELLEDGKFTDTQGTEYDLSGFLMVFTSNLAESNFDRVIPAELKSRFSCVTSFVPLSTENKNEYVVKRYNEIVTNYNSVFSKSLSVIVNSSELGIDAARFDNVRNLNSEIMRRFLRDIDYV